ncbi:MAG TPA: hypothetical protein VI565_06420 [Burkholderiales bacterium]|nr:hypothetical protein [Burkholderiales bacterium]
MFRAGGFERARNAEQAVAVRVGFDDGHHRLAANTRLNLSKIPDEIGFADFEPGIATAHCGRIASRGRRRQRGLRGQAL